ncbi:MAG: RAMP superfamily CRISPR-associated protein [Bryobacteraceae bacterium]
MPGNFRWITRKYTLEFLTPAFLGGADQSGQWRTPPFKALLRQWWRVVYAHQHDFQVDPLEMREAEGKLFGNAWLTNNRGETAASRSLVRLRLERWDAGAMKTWAGEVNTVKHPEVKQPIGPQLYLGYGPLTYDREKRGTALKAPPAIQAGEKAELPLAYPESHQSEIEAALALMNLYGAVGGRSRNGWGSFRLEPAGSVKPPFRPWREALTLDWPHCIGQDDTGPLIWQTRNEYADWKELMRVMAEIKIALRTQFSFAGIPQGGPEERHWLAYPVTNHVVKSWGNQARLPNSLRFKVRADEGTGKLRGVIFHMPCRPPAAFSPIQTILERVWQRVHQCLDQRHELERGEK